MITPLELELTIYQGATFTKTITWKTGSPAVAVDLTNYTAKMQIRETYNSTATAIEIGTEDSNGGGIVLGNNGVIELKITDTQTSGLTIKSGVYDLELTERDSNGAKIAVHKLLRGKVKIVPEVTK